MINRCLGGTIVLLIMLLPLPAAASDCWDAVSEQQDTGFDFVIESEVTGPSSGGVYTYTYRLYRVDQGDITYRDPSHVTVRFDCDSEPAASLIVGGVGGIMLSGATEGVHLAEVATSPFGFAEPGLGQDCRTNGIKLEFDDGALQPDGDGVSYPADPDDPVLVITFSSLGTPQDGLWFVKGGRKVTGSQGQNAGPVPGTTPGKPSHEVQYLTDGGSLLVPACRPPVAVERSSWGTLKQLYH